MVNIKLGRYRIRTGDPLNLVLVETRPITKGKNLGGEKEKLIGYYNTVEQAIKGWMRHEVEHGEQEIRTVEELQAQMDRMEEIVMEAMKNAL